MSRKPRSRRKPSRTLLVAAGFALLATAAFLYVAIERLERPRSGPDSGGEQTTVAIGGPFALTDQKGTPRTDADFRGRLMLVYFGYSFCPDVCALTLSNMGAALDRLGDKADEVTPIFITIDPERDTVARLAEYAKNFTPRLVALTGTKEQIAAAAKAYHVYYARNDEAGGKDYLMDHTSIIYLMDRQGRYLAHFGHTATVDRMMVEIGKYLWSAPKG
ncbi:MAG: SCO family protein [Alphaproteobacteria bacterium]